MIQVSIPASVPLKEFDYNAEVELVKRNQDRPFDFTEVAAFDSVN